MTPEQLQQFNEMKRILQNVVAVEDVQFIENVKRRTGKGLTEDGTTSASTITQSVRNSADTGSVDVCAEPDTKLKVITPTGTVYFLPAFTS